ncbi:MAG: glycosyltransferase family 4 protein [Alphaproteobacteria bacterium]|nr:glycosyltransferase family 4 protein [Alphaproteobacteria bacterium]
MHAVLQVTPSLNAGGVERTTIEVAEALTRAGGRALVASAGGQLEAELETVGGELVRLPLDAKSPLTVAANAVRLAGFLRRRRVAVVHARSRAPGWSALWAARRMGLPFVTTYHGLYNARSDLKRWYNSVMAKGDIVIANSEFTRAHVLREYGLAPDRVIAIPRGVDLKQFDPARIDRDAVAALRARWGFQSSGRILALMPTRITRWKGHEVLLEAAARVESERPGRLGVVMAGSAVGRENYRAELLRRIQDHGLQDIAQLVDHQNDMPAVLMAADVVVTPSIEPEAFGRVAVEAQAMGRPVVATAHGGFAETVQDGRSGLLVAPADAADLAQALVRMIDAGEEGRRRMGEIGMAHARPLYAKTTLQKATLGVYEKVLAEKR